MRTPHCFARTLVMTSAIVAAFASGSASAQTQRSAGENKLLLDHGRYLVKTTGCNDCHTPGYAPQAGKVDEKLWLTGDALGWRGPWGTTYASNLRLYMQNLTEAQWVKTAKSFQTRPPMPWFSLHAMTDRDLRAIYVYTRSLGPGGQPAPAYVPPDKTPTGPFIQFP
jgi:mono/diheme cytochrome c family protein